MNQTIIIEDVDMLLLEEQYYLLQEAILFLIKQEFPKAEDLDGIVYLLGDTLDKYPPEG